MNKFKINDLVKMKFYTEEEYRIIREKIGGWTYVNYKINYTNNINRVFRICSIGSTGDNYEVKRLGDLKDFHFFSNFQIEPATSLKEKLELLKNLK